MRPKHRWRADTQRCDRCHLTRETVYRNPAVFARDACNGGTKNPRRKRRRLIGFQPVAVIVYSDPPRILTREEVLSDKFLNAFLDAWGPQYDADKFLDEYTEANP